MKRGYKKGSPKKYPPRYCPYCKSKISKINRNGKRLMPSKYLEKKTCGEPICIGRSMDATHNPNLFYKLVIDTPFDRFCYTRLL